MRTLHALAAVMVATLMSPVAAAGTQEEPELTDAAGDCAFAAGNEYADIVAGWISDETATSFNVNIALAKWTLDQLGESSGFTMQFEHQGKQFGAAASYWGGTWQYENGYINLENGDSSDFTESTGSFTPGTPAILTIAFDKGHFDHLDTSDNALRNFQAGTADFKYYFAWGAAGQEAPVPPPFFGCDGAQSDATYEFKVGSHSMHAAAPAANATADAADGAANASASGASADADVAPLATDSGSADTPAPGALAVLAAIGAAAVVARARRK